MKVIIEQAVDTRIQRIADWFREGDDVKGLLALGIQLSLEADLGYGGSLDIEGVEFAEGEDAEAWVAQNASAIAAAL